MESKPGTEVVLNGKRYLYFAGTSYFQLHSHPEVIKAANDATLKYGIGSATTRAMTGTTLLLEKMEEKLAAYFNTEDAVYLPSGYLGSLAGLKALDEMKLFDTIFLDEESHYSLAEAALATGRQVVPFLNRDLDDLKTKMEKHLQDGKRPLVATNGLFPVMGTLAPIREYLQQAMKYNGVVWIDDAHGVGILGSHGRGTCEALGTPSDKLYMGATLSKAFGAYGGIVAGREEFIKKVRSGTVMIGSSSPMNAAVAAGLKGLELVQESHHLRKKLWDNALYLRDGLGHIGILSETVFIPKNHGTIPIASFVRGDAANMKAIHRFLMDRGIYIQYTSYKGAGPEGVLRIVVTSTHKKAEMVRLTQTLKEAFRSLNS
jgi:7-keto-8-aminopelargonate synthetase-like enzyme